MPEASLLLFGNFKEKGWLRVKFQGPVPSRIPQLHLSIGGENKPPVKEQSTGALDSVSWGLQGLLWQHSESGSSSGC